MSPALIDAVLFDLGNVLVEWDPYRPYVGRFDRSDVEDFFASIDFFAFNHEQDAGRTWAQARAVLAERDDGQARMLDVYVEHFDAAVVGELPGAAELVDDLLRTGTPAYGLTNWPAETFHVAGRNAPVVNRLRGVVVSGREGIAKPDPRIYDLAAGRFGLDPARTLFVDDRAVNVDAAVERGFLGEVFGDHGTLRRRLRGLGVAVPDAAGA